MNTLDLKEICLSVLVGRQAPDFEAAAGLGDGSIVENFKLSDSNGKLRVRNAAGRMGELIDSMLKMSRLSRSELRLAPVDIALLARELVRDLQANEPERSVAVDIAPGLEAFGDPVLVRSLLQNLLDNAW